MKLVVLTQHPGQSTMDNTAAKMPRWTSPPVDTFEAEADWAAINKINRAYEARGRGALNKALADLKKRDSVRYVRIASAYEMISEATAVSAAEAELTEDDFFRLLNDTKSPASSQ